MYLENRRRTVALWLVVLLLLLVALIGTIAADNVSAIEIESQRAILECSPYLDEVVGNPCHLPCDSGQGSVAEELMLVLGTSSQPVGSSQPDELLCEIGKHAEPAVVAPGGVLTFTIVVTNTGGQPLVGTIVTDAVPEHTSYIPYGSGYYNHGKREIIWYIDRPEQTWRESFRVRVDRDVPVGGVVVNHRYLVQSDERYTQGKPVSVRVQPLDLSLMKIGPSEVHPGDRITYRLVYSNAGPAAEDVMVTDTLPSQVTFIGASPPPTRRISQQVIWHLGTVPSSSHTIVLTGAVSNAIVRPMSLVNSAEISTPLRETRLDNNRASHTTVVRQRTIFLPLALRTIFANGGFESGSLVGWTDGQEGEMPGPTVVTQSRTGRYALLLGDPAAACNNAPVGKAWIQQDIIVPNDLHPKLRFWYHLISYDRNLRCSANLDRVVLLVDGQELGCYANQTDTYGCTNPPVDLGWQEAVISLASYRGRRVAIRLELQSQPDKWYNTWVYVDDFRIE